jgi:hypothetical protein
MMSNSKDQDAELDKLVAEMNSASASRHAQTVIWQKPLDRSLGDRHTCDSALDFPCRCRLASLVMKAARCPFV